MSTKLIQMKNAKLSFCYLALVTLSNFLPGCKDRVTAPEADFVCIKEIEVTGETDGITTSLEVEVHLYEDGTRRFLGCSGLLEADLADSLYQVEAFFMKHSLSGGSFLMYDEVSGKNIYLIVSEDDRSPCPAEVDTIPDANDDLRIADDVIGISAPFSGQLLRAPQNMSFGRVVHLQMTVKRRRI
jgi:hypothetical protein